MSRLSPNQKLDEKKIEFAKLQPFASSKHLQFIFSQNTKYGFYIGDYCNHIFKIEPIIKSKFIITKYIYGIRIFVSVDRVMNDSLQHRSNLNEKQIPVEDMMNLIIPSSSRHILKNIPLNGIVKTKTIDRKMYLVYEQNNTKMTNGYFQKFLNIFSDLADAWSSLISIGGESLPLLTDMIKNNHNKSIAAELLREISQKTKAQFEHRSSQVFCQLCLTRYKAHEIIITGVLEFIELKSKKTMAFPHVPKWVGGSINYSNGITISSPFPIYYGCRICGQSRKYFECRIIAILDNRTDDERSEQDGILRVNWLKRRSLFDFDEVEIISATDEDVERFAVQVGNDNDPVRRPLYKKMRCTVASDCELTENTLRVLRNMFGTTLKKSL